MGQPFGIETSTIGAQLFNPTDEDLEARYAGISLTIKSGEKQVFEINCARHLLNEFSRRGLCRLPIGCTAEQEKKIAADGIEANRKFKVDMITKFNERNENRRSQGLGMLTPDKYLRKISKETGLVIVSPYENKDEERVELNGLTKENEALKREMAELRDMMKQVLAAKEPAKPAEDFDCPQCRRVFGTKEALDNHIKSHKG